MEALKLRSPELARNCLALVVSHDCDLACSPEQELSAEVIVGRRIGEMDGNYTFAKNARKLHLPFRAGETSIVGEFLITERKLVPKAELASFQPRSDLELAPQDRVVLQRWLAARYRRASFPDEFERRLERAGLKDRIAKLLKKHGSYIRAIFFDVDGGKEKIRSGPDDVYELDIILLHTTDDPDNAFKAASDLRGEIESAFAKRLRAKDEGWQFIELRDCIVVADEALTVKQATVLKEWRLEHLSLREDPPQATLE